MNDWFRFKSSFNFFVCKLWNMYLESKYTTGDAASVGEELLMGVSELKERARVVDKAVREGYFTFEEALSLYKVSEIEYLTYSLLKN